MCSMSGSIVERLISSRSRSQMAPMEILKLSTEYAFFHILGKTVVEDVATKLHDVTIHVVRRK